MPEFNAQQVRQNCERQLGAFGAKLFLNLIGFSGLPTGRLFVWAQRMQVLLHPDGKGACDGKLGRPDISKWKRLVRPDGKTERETRKVDLEFTVSDFKLKSDRRTLTVLLAFERVSETLLIYAARQACSLPMVISTVIELERIAVLKLKLPRNQARRKVLWLPRQPAYQEIPADLCPSSEASDGSPRVLKKIAWGTGEVRFYPDDWACDWLEKPVLPLEYPLSSGFPLAACRHRSVEFVRAFNLLAKNMVNQRGVSPSIVQMTRPRQVKEMITG